MRFERIESAEEGNLDLTAAIHRAGEGVGLELVDASAFEIGNAAEEVVSIEAVRREEVEVLRHAMTEA